MTEEEIRAKIAQLTAENEDAGFWGGAITARAEYIAELRAMLPRELTGEEDRLVQAALINSSTLVGDAMPHASGPPLTLARTPTGNASGPVPGEQRELYLCDFDAQAPEKVIINGVEFRRATPTPASPAPGTEETAADSHTAANNFRFYEAEKKMRRREYDLRRKAEAELVVAKSAFTLATQTMVEAHSASRDAMRELLRIALNHIPLSQLHLRAEIDRELEGRK